MNCGPCEGGIVTLTHVPRFFRHPLPPPLDNKPTARGTVFYGVHLRAHQTAQRLKADAGVSSVIAGSFPPNGEAGEPVICSPAAVTLPPADAESGSPGHPHSEPQIVGS